MKIDRKLIEACAKEDRKAQHELYKLCFSPLLSICYRFSNNKDDASILLNEAFYKILQNIDKQNPDIPFFAWAKRITVNYCINEYRKNNTRKKYVANAEHDELDQAVVYQIEVDEDQNYSERDLERVKQEILNLPPTTQEVFQLFILDGYSHQEIGELLDMKEGTSKWHVNNARKKLKAIFKDTLNILSGIAL